MPLISIITVVFNNKNLLEKTIQSVDNQCFNSFEYIVVDGNSTDGSLDVITKYETKISAWKSESDSGIYDAMNKGINMAHGEWTLFLNAGDVFVDENVLQKISPYLVENEYDVVYGDILKYDKNGGLYLKKSDSPRDSHKMYFCHQGVFCRTQICREMPFDITYSMSADFKFFKLAFLKGYRFKQTDIPVAIFDTKGISNQNRLKGLWENVRVVQEINVFFDRIKLLAQLYYVIFFIKLRQVFDFSKKKK